MITLRMEFEERLAQFQEGYDWEETDEAIRTLTLTGELLELMFPGDEAALGMLALEHIIRKGIGRDWKWSSLDNHTPDQSWRETWSEIDGWNASSTPPFLDELHDLNAFANYGILPIWSFAGNEELLTPAGADMAKRLEHASDVPAYIYSICSKIDRLERLLPSSDAITAILRTRDHARARLALDDGQAITLHQLALLSGVTTKRLQNAVYAKTDEAPVVGRTGLITPEACEAWLQARDYQRSIWKDVQAQHPLDETWGKDVELMETEANEQENFVFIPVANDGSQFVPSLHRDGKDHPGGYTIGAKGNEVVIANFDDALSQLQSMQTPRWRRPNAESGNWGIVSGQSWLRIKRTELERL